jgi:hypothetical protein
VGDGDRGLVGELGVLVDDDDQSGRSRCGHPQPLPVRGQLTGADLEYRDCVGEQCSCSVRCRGEPAEAGCPRLQLHPALEIDAPKHDVGAGDEFGEDDVEDAALAGTGDTAEQAVPVRQAQRHRLSVLEQTQRYRAVDRPL